MVSGKRDYTVFAAIGKIYRTYFLLTPYTMLLRNLIPMHGYIIPAILIIIIDLNCDFNSSIADHTKNVVLALILSQSDNDSIKCR